MHGQKTASGAPPSCWALGNEGPVSTPANPGSYPLLSWDADPARKPWSTQLIDSIRANKSALDAGHPEAILPAYPRLSEPEQIRFWAELVISMACAESNWDAAAVTPEPRLDEASIGLLQLSPGDATRYGLEPIAANGDALKDPLLNLRWAVAILSFQVARDGVVAQGAGSKPRRDARGAARYWRVLWDEPGHADRVFARVRGVMGTR